MAEKPAQESSANLRERGRRALKRSLRSCEGVAANGGTCSDPVEVACINDALRRLSPIERDVLLVVRLEGRSYAEIARQLGVSVTELERLFAAALSEYLRNLEHPLRHWWRLW